MPIRPGSNEKHTFRLSNLNGSFEMNTTVEGARHKANKLEEPSPHTIFGAGRVKIEMWSGKDFVEISRYRPYSRYTGC